MSESSQLVAMASADPAAGVPAASGLCSQGIRVDEATEAVLMSMVVTPPALVAKVFESPAPLQYSLSETHSWLQQHARRSIDTC